MTRGPAFYARTGTPAGDLVALLHLPYTTWHLSYVAIGAGLASELDVSRLIGTLTAFALGLGIGAHALDEVHDRPLGTTLPGATLWLLGIGGLAGAAAIAVVGAFAISPWVLAWAAVGIALAAGYGLEWSQRLHSDGGFAVAWGSFPVVAGYWAQEEALSAAALLAAAAAAALSLAQRRLSTPARTIRRTSDAAELSMDGEPAWDRVRVLATWEGPLKAMAWAMPLLAAALLARPR